MSHATHSEPGLPMVSPRDFLSFVKGVVNMAYFQLMHVRLGILFKDMIMCNVNNTIVSQKILYKESNNCCFVFVLTSESRCLSFQPLY